MGNTLLKSEMKVELLFEWIQQLVVENISSGVLSIPPPILSRSFQELANGMVEHHNALKIAEIPYPFPYAQVCDCVLLAHWILTPIVTAVWVSHPVWAGVFSFVQVFILWSLNLTAIEIENPYGRDANDISGEHLQKQFNKELMLLVQPETERTPKMSRRRSGVSSQTPPLRSSFSEL